MRVFKGALLVFAVVTTAAAQSPEPPIAETRLTVHTLLREDVFAGFFENNSERVARAEQNIELLLEQRPAERAQPAGVEGRHRRAACRPRPRDRQRRGVHEALQRRAGGLRRGHEGVDPATTASRRSSAARYAFFGDRLPQEHRAAAWAQAYDSYSLLWKQQARAGRKDAAALQGRAALRAWRSRRSAPAAPRSRRSSSIGC